MELNIKSTSKRVFLPRSATEEDVREHFKVVGDDIVRVTLMSRQKNAKSKGKGKGFGFLELANATAYTVSSRGKPLMVSSSSSVPLRLIF